MNRLDAAANALSSHASVLGAAAVALLCLSLVGCVHSPDFVLVHKVVGAPAALPAAPKEPVADRWWEAFGDPGLNEAVDAALAGNLDLAAVLGRLRAAEAVAARKVSDLAPEVSSKAGGGVTIDEGESSEQFNLELAATYELDLWGRLESRAEAERFRMEATRASYQARAVTLSAHTTTTWLRLIDSASRAALQREQLDATERVLKLLEARLRSGASRRVDVLRQQRLVAANRQQLNQIETERQLFLHQLAVLQGRHPTSTPAGLRDGATELPSMPPFPALGVPVDLVQRRPDTRAAFYELQAANQEIAAAISERYPRLRFDLSLVTSDSHGTTLFEEWAASFAGSLAAPLLDFGRRKAEVSRTEAEAEALLQAYGQVTLTAFQEVEDALLRERRQLETIDEIAHQVALAEQAHAQLRLEYLNGVGNFIDVLTSQTELQRLQRDLFGSRRLALEYRVALYRALAGGFESN